jgi:hypothetical protein
MPATSLSTEAAAPPVSWGLLRVTLYLLPVGVTIWGVVIYLIVKHL